MTDLSIEKIIPAGKSKTEFVEDILFHMGNMHSHVDIIEDDGGYALIRTYEIDDALLEDYGVPAEKHLGWTKTLDDMHDTLIRNEGPYYRRVTQNKNRKDTDLTP